MFFLNIKDNNKSLEVLFQHILKFNNFPKKTLIFPTFDNSLHIATQ